MCDMLAEEFVVHNPSCSIERLLSFSNDHSCDEMMRAQVSEYFAHEPDILDGSALLCQVVEDMGEQFWRQSLDWWSRHDELDSAGDEAERRLESQVKMSST
jgi:hypothetical protein